MVSIFLFIKENIPPLWKTIECLNSVLFKIVYHSKIQKALIQTIQKQTLKHYTIRLLTTSDIDSLSILIKSQEPEQLIYFEPHNFDFKSLERIFRNPSFFRMGIFFNNRIVGYFFLRCFVNKECFVGRLVDKYHRVKGIGKAMNDILYNTAWNSGFRVFATLSADNQMVMQSHKNNRHLIIRKKLADNYMLVEFVKEYLLKVSI